MKSNKQVYVLLLTCLGAVKEKIVEPTRNQFIFNVLEAQGVLLMALLMAAYATTKYYFMFILLKQFK